MDLFLSDPSEIPLPPEEVRIRSVSVEPWPDGRRLRIKINIDPFQQRPNLDIRMHRSGESEMISETTIIGTMTPKNEVNLHFRNVPPSAEYLLTVVLYYSNQNDLPEPGSQPPLPDITPIITDQQDLIIYL